MKKHVPLCGPRDEFERRLIEFEDLALGEAVIVEGLPENCDACGESFEGKRFMIDAPMSEGGPWGWHCARCFAARGGVIAWGSAQLYTRLADGTWLLTGGGPL